MTFDRIREHNRIALLRVLGLLFAAVGLVRGGTVAVLPRHLRLSVLRLLRPLESATLRLVIVAARGMTVPVPSTRRGDAARAKKPRKSGARNRAFPLVESLPRNAAPKPRYVPGPGPRISFFDGSDPVIETPPAPSPDDPVDAARLCRRLLAVAGGSDGSGRPVQARKAACPMASAARCGCQAGAHAADPAGATAGVSGADAA